MRTWKLEVDRDQPVWTKLMEAFEDAGIFRLEGLGVNTRVMSTSTPLTGGPTTFELLEVDVTGSVATQEAIPSLMDPVLREVVGRLASATQELIPENPALDSQSHRRARKALADLTRITNGGIKHAQGTLPRPRDEGDKRS